MWAGTDFYMSDQIYVALLDEGVEVWRPVAAERNADASYRILGSGDHAPSVESWQFPPGSVVVCEPRQTSAGSVLAAVRLRDAAAPAGDRPRRVG